MLRVRLNSGKEIELPHTAARCLIRDGEAKLVEELAVEPELERAGSRRPSLLKNTITQEKP
jgi:hypothetical protein